MGECINPAFHARVIVEGITVKFDQFRDIPLQDKASKGRSNVSFDKSSSLEGHKALEILDKEHYVSIINVFIHKHYLAFSIRLIEMVR